MSEIPFFWKAFKDPHLVIFSERQERRRILSTHAAAWGDCTHISRRNALWIFEHILCFELLLSGWKPRLFKLRHIQIHTVAISFPLMYQFSISLSSFSHATSVYALNEVILKALGRIRFEWKAPKINISKVSQGPRSQLLELGREGQSAWMHR